MGVAPGREERGAAADMTLWHGRFDEPMDEALFELSESFSFDHELWRHDIAGSKAHVRGLERAGLISASEAADLSAALDAVADEFASDAFVREATDEDVHMAIERRVIELAGDTGAKLHTARSRNDQVATTLRLFTRDALSRVARQTLALARTLDEVGASRPTAVLPGYTHLQRAQPVLLSHHLRAHAWSLTRDVDRILSMSSGRYCAPFSTEATRRFGKRSNMFSNTIESR